MDPKAETLTCVIAAATTTPWWSDATIVAGCVGAFGALLGAIIGGKFVMAAADKANAEQAKRDKTNRDEAIRGVLQALHEEMRVLWESYLNGISADIRQLRDGQGLRRIYPLHSDYFTLYGANAALIGHIQPAELREAIVEAYTRSKSVLDILRMNNEFVNERNRIVRVWGQLGTPNAKADVDEATKILDDYGVSIRLADAEMIRIIPNALAALEEAFKAKKPN